VSGAGQVPATPIAEKVSVIGSGSWGTAAAGLVAKNAGRVVIWARSEEVASSIREAHVNPRHLRDYVLPDNVSSTSDFAEVARESEALVVAVPSDYLRSTMRALAPHVGADVPVVVLTKGIEPGTHLHMAGVVADELGGPARVAALSGPNHAEEICRGMFSAAVVAAGDMGLARRFQTLFHSDAFRAYASDDLEGVEVCAAVKNVIAIACGVAVGLGAGDNTLAVIMTRGLAEISRVVAAVGGNPMTCMGLAGMGDLVATCTSPHSRNRSFGEAFAAGRGLADYERETGMVVEGARAALSTWELARELSIETPLTDAVHAILHENMDVSDVIEALRSRSPKEEFYGIGSQH
jgi:glycerol-3-phosphate dehydrogenase (NAD(P)+)